MFSWLFLLQKQLLLNRVSYSDILWHVRNILCLETQSKMSYTLLCDISRKAAGWTWKKHTSLKECLKDVHYTKSQIEESVFLQYLRLNDTTCHLSADTGENISHRDSL